MNLEAVQQDGYELETGKLMVETIRENKLDPVHITMVLMRSYA
jgi:hypothetical protein